MSNPESSEQKNLIIYRASAGSGKTHRLTAEYLRLLFTHPFAYRHILAVTFTNKATDEMKVRIITELHKLASGKDSDHLTGLMNEKGESEAKIREKALKTLVYILHDYSAFSVSTIDRFFQQTMRAFTREIGISGGYSVELDQNRVLREAIDSLLSDLNASKGKQLLEWLIRFSEEKIENGDTWNIKKDIQNLSEEIFKESYKVFSDEIQKDIADKTILSDYKNMLLSIIRSFEKQSKDVAQKALNIIERYGLSIEDFKGKSRSPFSAFIKLAQGEINSPNSSFINLAGNIDNWINSKNTSENISHKIEEAYANGLNECVEQVIELYNNTKVYQTAYEINRYYFALGILGDVDKKIREYTAENNIMLISDTTELLHKIIKGTDTPFIYEKVGTYINHYMIDEFQDTSGMQWDNFRPLISDSLAHGNRNLIVGDVKQSIYRWRNSDWKLLEEQLDYDFSLESIIHRSLDTNWRSSKNIVNFNNAVFEVGASILQNEFNESIDESSDNKTIELNKKIENAYSRIKQNIAPNKSDEEGHVRVQFIDTTENPDWQTYVLEQIPHSIEELQDKGYQLKDIAILVRTKREGADIANKLLTYKSCNPDSKYRYDIISDEALYISNSKSIKLVVSLLRYLQNPSDQSLQTLAIHEYYKTKEQLDTSKTIQKYFSIINNFPDEITAEFTRIRELPLYEMAESIFNLFHDAMDENENIYIQSFLDMILDFTTRSSADLDAFLQWWDESGTSKTIFTPDEQDAIRIMTIHKSKGLGFEAVILPFCNWDIDHKLPTILWCEPKIKPFNDLRLVPVKYSQKLKNTIFEYEYLNEKMHVFVDNLNVMYVAFTRAKKELIAFAPKPVREKITNTSSLLWQCINGFENYDEENDLFETGKDYRNKKTTKYTRNNEIKINSLVSIPYDSRLKLRLNNKYYFSESGKREYGTLMHEIISKVQSLDKLEDVVDGYFIEGYLTAEEKAESIKQITRFLTNETVKEWYSEKYRVLNEVEILQFKGSFIRPDRVMIKEDEVIVIDYKFGEKEDKKYIRQVKYYMNQIAKMGYTNLKGYICYVTLDKIIEVE